MKKILILFLLLLPAILQAQYSLPSPPKLQANIFQYADPLDSGDKLFGRDKLYHIEYGAVGTIFVCNILHGLKVKNCIWKGAALSYVIGAGKELVNDPRPSALDMTANLFAVATGALISHFQIKNGWNDPGIRFKRKGKVIVTNQIQ